MKTFLKVVLVVALLIVAIKLSPIIFFSALVGLIAASILGAVGLSLLAIVFAVLVALALALAPIWIPALVIVGLISLFKGSDQQPKPPVVTV